MMERVQSDVNVLMWIVSTLGPGLACECYRWPGIQVPSLPTGFLKIQLPRTVTRYAFTMHACLRANFPANESHSRSTTK